MIQYFSKSTELSRLKQLPILRESQKIISISYPHNDIHKLPAALSKAQNLQQIDLSYNKLTSVDTLCDLRRLRIINLSHNQISIMPKSILRLRKVEVLDLGYNLLSHMNHIGVLFELKRIRKAQVQIIVQGNQVYAHHKLDIDRTFQSIALDIENAKKVIDNRNELQQLQISKSVDIHRRTLTHPLDQDQSLSKIMPMGTKIIGSLQQARNCIEVSLSAVVQFERKFAVMAASEFKGWNEDIVKKFKNQETSVKSLIEMYKDILMYLKDQFTSASQATTKLQTSFIQATEVQELIKDQHSILLQALSQSHDVPMSSYKVWVQLYRDLRVLGERIRWEGWSLIQNQIRNQQIEALKLISPTKFDINKEIKKTQNNLQVLLFSKSKEIQKQSTVQNQECCECFIKTQQVRQLREIVQMLTTQNLQYKQKNESIVEQNTRLQKQQQILGYQLRNRQQQIVKCVKQNIDSSVYQKVLLEQAKGIEDLIKCDRHKKFNTLNNFQNTQKFGNLCQTATAIAKDKAIQSSKQFVSQFNCQQRDSYYQNNKRPYFSKNLESATPGNDQSSKRSKRHTINSVASSTEKKRKLTIEPVVRNNQHSSNGRTNLLSRKVTERQQNSPQNGKAHQNNRVDSQNSQNKRDKDRYRGRQNNKSLSNNQKNVIISDFAITQTGKQNYNKQITSSRQVLAELVARKCNGHLINLKQNNNLNNVENNKIKKQSQTVLQSQNIPKYIPTDYHSIEDLKDQQSYENYMKFHLRNNIIETLEKKGKRYSLNKETQKSKDKTMTLNLKQKIRQHNRKNESQRKISSRAVTSDRNLKAGLTKNIPLSSRIVSNSKSYVEMLGKLRH